MTQSNPLELAKQGDPEAIATLMNRTLQPKGMKAIVSRLNDHLEVVLELDVNQVPNRQALTQFVQGGLKSLGLTTAIQSVTVVGKQANSDLPVWEERFTLGSVLGGTSPPPPPPSRLPLASRPLNPAAPDGAMSTTRNGYADSPNPTLTTHAPPPPIPPLKPEAPFPISQLPEDDIDPGMEDLEADLVQVVGAMPPDQPLPPDIANSILAAPPQVYERIAPPQPGAVDVPADPSVPVAPGVPVPESGEEAVPTTQFPDLSSEEYVVFGDLDLPASTPAPQPGEEFVHPDKSLTVVDAPPPGSPPAMPLQPGRFSPGLLVGIIAAAVTGGLAFGIIGYALVAALNRSDSTPDAVVAPVSPPPPANSGTPAPPSQDPQADFQSAVASGDRALITAQTAQSLDDWQWVVSQLDAAIASLQTVPADNANYQTAQAKIAEFEAALAPARQRANQPVPNALPPTATTTISGALVCQEVPSSNESPAVELTNVQFEGSGEAGGAVTLVGCLTNHTNQAIASVSVNYDRPTAPSPAPVPAPDAATPSPSPPPLETIVLGGVDADSTIPFRSPVSLPADAPSLTIRSLTWSGPDLAEPQQIPLASPIQLSRE